MAVKGTLWNTTFDMKSLKQEKKKYILEHKRGINASMEKMNEGMMS
jgi:hypothetical protein